MRNSPKGDGVLWYKVHAIFKPPRGVIGTISGGECDRVEMKQNVRCKK